MTGRHPDRFELLAVSVGRPAPLGDHLVSAIRKQRVTAGTWLQLSDVNLDGDAQADLRVHGGPDKAVYAYPSEHLLSWRAELHQPLDEAAPFGENLSTAGATEADVVLGERWGWGGAVLEVCQPRWPCPKLIAYRGRKAAERVADTGRSGWYLRVLQQGRVPVDGPIEVLERPEAPSILEAFLARTDLHNGNPARAEQLVDHPALAEQWRSHLAAGLRTQGRRPT